MKFPITLVTLCAGVVLTAFPQKLDATESTWDFSVQLSAQMESSPPKITLSWPQDTGGTPMSYTVYRKNLSSTNWGVGTVLAGTTTQYMDTQVMAGAAYEYQVVKKTQVYKGYGYIYAGIRAPLIEQRGKVLLMVDKTFARDLERIGAVGTGFGRRRLDGAAPRCESRRCAFPGQKPDPGRLRD